MLTISVHGGRLYFLDLEFVSLKALNLMKVVLGERPDIT